VLFVTLYGLLTYFTGPYVAKALGWLLIPLGRQASTCPHAPHVPRAFISQIPSCFGRDPRYGRGQPGCIWINTGYMGTILGLWFMAERLLFGVVPR